MFEGILGRDSEVDRGSQSTLNVRSGVDGHAEDHRSNEQCGVGMAHESVGCGAMGVLPVGAMDVLPVGAVRQHADGRQRGLLCEVRWKDSDQG